MAEEESVGPLFKVVVTDRKGHTEIRATGLTLEAAKAIEKSLKDFGPFKKVEIVPDPR